MTSVGKHWVMRPTTGTRAMHASIKLAKNETLEEQQLAKVLLATADKMVENLNRGSIVDDMATAKSLLQATISKSPVFKAMLENEMEESRSGTIKMSDVSYDVLRSFVHYMYTAEVVLDEQMACELLVLAEKYQVKYLKAFCEKFITSKVNNENAVMSFAFAHRHNAKNLLEAALSLITDNMDTLTERDEYKELVEKDPRLVVEIYEAYLAKQVNTAAKE